MVLRDSGMPGNIIQSVCAAPCSVVVVACYACCCRACCCCSFVSYVRHQFDSMRQMQQWKQQRAVESTNRNSKSSTAGERMTMALDKAKQCRVATCLDDVTTTAMTTTTTATETITAAAAAATMTTKAAVAAAAAATAAASSMSARTTSSELSCESEGEDESDGEGEGETETEGEGESECKSVDPVQKLGRFVVPMLALLCCSNFSCFSAAFPTPPLPLLHFFSNTFCSSLFYAALPHPILLSYVFCTS